MSKERFIGKFISSIFKHEDLAITTFPHSEYSFTTYFRYSEEEECYTSDSESVSVYDLLSSFLKDIFTGQSTYRVLIRG